MADVEFEPSRLNSSYSQAAIDEQFQEMRENMDSKFESILAKIEFLLKLSTASQPQPSLRSVKAKTSTKQHSLMQSRQSMHSGPAQYEDANKTPTKQHSLRLSRQSMYSEANFRHKAQSQDTTQSGMPNETTIPVVPLYIGMNIVNKPFISNNFNNKNVSDHTHNDKELVQYHNPHQRKLNVLSKNHHNNENNDDNDEHNDDDEHNDACYVIDEVFGGRNHSIEGHNPGYNVKNTLSSIDREITSMLC
jgi:hypothetical protein